MHNGLQARFIGLEDVFSHGVKAQVNQRHLLHFLGLQARFIGLEDVFSHGVKAQVNQRHLLHFLGPFLYEHTHEKMRHNPMSKQTLSSD